MAAMTEDGTGGIIDVLNFLGRAGFTASSQEDALDELAGMRASTAVSPWRLDRAEVADRAEALVRDPSLVQQGDIGVCGPATFVYYWIARDPVAFATFTRSLYDTASASLGPPSDRVEMKPDEDLVNQDYPAVRARMRCADVVSGCKIGRCGVPCEKDCPPAEWMVMSTLRDCANEWLDFEGTPEEDYAPGTRVNELVDWFEMTQLWSDVRAVSCKWDDAQWVSELRPGATRDVMLVVHLDKLGHGRHGGWHLYGLETTPVRDGDWIDFRRWTWGRRSDSTALLSKLEQGCPDVVIAEV